MSKILSLLLPVFLLIIGVQFIRDYLGAISPGEKEKFQSLVDSGEKAPAILSAEYQEKTTKIKRIRTKTYVFNYEFKVDEKTYTGSHTFDDLPSDPMVEVTYLKGSPEVNAVDPQTQLADSAEGKTSALLIGIGLILGGLGLGYYRYNTMKKAA